MALKYNQQERIIQFFAKNIDIIGSLLKLKPEQQYQHFFTKRIYFVIKK
jgi:hypothetical protein